MPPSVVGHQLRRMQASKGSCEKSIKGGRHPLLSSPLLSWWLTACNITYGVVVQFEKRRGEKTQSSCFSISHFSFLRFQNHPPPPPPLPPPPPAKASWRRRRRRKNKKFRKLLVAVLNILCGERERERERGRDDFLRRRRRRRRQRRRRRRRLEIHLSFPPLPPLPLLVLLATEPQLIIFLKPGRMPSQ